MRSVWRPLVPRGTFERGNAMPFSTPRAQRGRLVIAVTLSATTVAATALLPEGGSAATSGTVVKERPRQHLATGDHAMGSQIRKHEGTGDMPMAVHPTNARAPAVVHGIDVSSHQGNVDWSYWWNRGKRFTWVKATEGTGYTNPYYGQQYNGSYRQGFIRGAYHFALPDRSSGAAQARFFSNHGGGWTDDGKTLPGTLDMEWNPYGGPCYGKTKQGMTQWIKAFSNTYHARWDKWPAIYTSTSWWSQCVSSDLSGTNPLWVARYSSSPGTLPCCWSTYSVWQYSSDPIDK